MSTIHLHQTTTLTPEQYVAGLTDFGPGRAKLFANSADEYLTEIQASRHPEKMPGFHPFIKKCSQREVDCSLESKLIKFL